MPGNPDSSGQGRSPVREGGEVHSVRSLDGALKLIERLGCCFSEEEMNKVLNREWVKDAKCKGIATRMFFPVRGEPTDSAKAVCNGCSVRKECLEYALVINEHIGIWGGLTELERRKIRKALRKGLNFICGVLPDGWDFDRKLLDSHEHTIWESDRDNLDVEINLDEDYGKESSCE